LVFIIGGVANPDRQLPQRYIEKDMESLSRLPHPQSDQVEAGFFLQQEGLALP
jgi:hypothetical protein